MIAITPSWEDEERKWMKVWESMTGAYNMDMENIAGNSLREVTESFLPQGDGRLGWYYRKFPGRHWYWRLNWFPDHWICAILRSGDPFGKQFSRGIQKKFFFLFRYFYRNYRTAAGSWAGKPHF